MTYCMNIIKDAINGFTVIPLYLPTPFVYQSAMFLSTESSSFSYSQGNAHSLVAVAHIFFYLYRCTQHLASFTALWSIITFKHTHTQANQETQNSRRCKPANQEKTWKKLKTSTMEKAIYIKFKIRMSGDK